MGKKMVAVTIDEEVHKAAKDAGINISYAAEDGILKSMMTGDLAEYPLELAESDPENYWIKPLDGKCHKRGKPMFFDQDPMTNKVYEITKEEYIKRYKSRVKQSKEVEMTEHDLKDGTWMSSEEIKE